jgi:hypothetical protein
MRRAAISSLLVVLAGAGALPAEVFKGKLKEVDGDKGTLVLTVGGKDRKFEVPAGAKITIQVAAFVLVPKEGIKDPRFKTAVSDTTGGYSVEITLEKKGKKDVVTKVHLSTPTRKLGPPDPEDDPAS